MKKIFLLLCIVFVLSSFSFWYKELLLENRNGHPIRVVRVVLDWQDFVVTSLATTWGATLQELVEQVGWDIGVNGTFFCPKDYSYCGGETYANFERVYLWDAKSYSKYWPDTSVRMIFGFDKEGIPMMAQNNLSQEMGLWSDENKDKMNDLYFWLSNFTILLKDGKDVTESNIRFFDQKMWGSANRNFICFTEDKKEVYLWIVGWMSIYNLWYYLKSQFWCYDALALDAGYSEAMMYSGYMLKTSSRTQIMDAFVVVDREHYIKLTWYEPVMKEKYIPENSYTMNKKDWQLVDLFWYIFEKKIKKNEESRVWIISKVRFIKSLDQIRKDSRLFEIFHQVLFNLYISD